MSQPEKFEHYELLKNADGSVLELGHGAMGVTYKAFDTNLRCTVALKVISSAYLNDPTAAERFLREARGAAQLRHRNVASVFHLGRHGESYFYAMEFIEGENVDEHVKRAGPIETLLALEITAQVTSALIAAHHQGLVHRDIKPSNLMLVREGDGELSVKLIDFGLVKSALIGSTAGALTSGGFVGTPYFASPEQLDQRTEDIRSDLYSLGVTLWFMLTGKPTFMGSVASVIAQHLDKPPAFESLAVLPACVVSVLRKMLEKDVEKRLQTPAELRAELKRCQEILRASGAVASGAGTATMTFDEAFETIGLSSTHGLRPTPQAGLLLADRYRLIEDLAPESPGRTFHAEDVSQKRRVRVRIVQCSSAAFSAIRTQVAQLQPAALRNFADVLAADHTGAFGYVVSEWLEGFALVEVLRARRELTFRETLTLLEQIAPAIDAARDLGVRPAVDLRHVFVHFPEGLAEADEQVILRCPLAEWPAFVVKLEPLGRLPGTDAGNDPCERTIMPNEEVCRSATIAQAATLAYDLLGGKPGASGPLANVSEEGNEALRRARGGGDHFLSAREFVAVLSESAPADFAARSSSGAEPQPAGQLRAVAAAAAAKFSPSTSTSAPIGGVPKLWGRPRWTVFVGLAALLALAIFSLIQPREKSRPTLGKPSAASTPAVAIAAPPAQRAPPKPGLPWKNSLETRYVPVGDVHFSTIETRVKDFAAFVQAQNFDAEGGMYSLQRDGFKQHRHTWRNPGFPQSPEHPVVGVSYDDANYFCEWLTRKERAEGLLKAGQFYRLPTDREWSAAAGVGLEPGASPEERSEKVKVTAWGTGKMPDNAGNYAGAEAAGNGFTGEWLAANAPAGWPTIAGYRDTAPRTCAVPGFGPNARGIFDLGGNVWEWCQDRYNKTANWRVLRGGAWTTSRPQELLLSFRRGYNPSFRHDDVGFRCVVATDAGKIDP